MNDILTNDFERDYIDGIMNKFIQLGIQSHSQYGGIGMWPNEIEQLVWCAFMADPVYNFVEIGSFNGGSAAALCLVKEDFINKCTDKNFHSKVISVDIKFNKWFDFIVYERGKFQNIHQKIEIDSSFLSHHLESPVSLCLIDGFHSFRQVITDFIQIDPFMVSNSYILFHDASPHIFDPIYQQKQLNFANTHYDELMHDQSENFFIDEAVLYICNKFNYEIINIPVADHKMCHSVETGLTQWVRGKTSPFSSIVGVKKNES